MSKQKSNQRRRKARRSPLPVPLLIAVGGVILLGAALFAFWRSQQPSGGTVPVEVSGQPSLKVDQEFVDFGEVKVDEMVSVTFTLSNVGDETLRFEARPYVEVVEGC